MSSIIPGYEYDIFISYRQKDNKYDGWVTEFVNNLKRELESAFKEEVSVYFDINPHDGLLETYDVTASLEEKLKCLVFIPIISRTYCDPKSYAWNHEFKAFVELSSQDHFGLKVRLPNGNVAARVLPVRINDLNNSDLLLCESTLGGVLRGVDFIYKSAGVNRPLRSMEENPHDNLNHTIYRDQINKVSLAVMDIIESLKDAETQYLKKVNGIKVKETPGDEEQLVEEPEKGEKIKLNQEGITDKIKPRKKGGILNFFNTRLLLAFYGFMILIILLASILIIHHHLRVKWAREVGLPEIEKLKNEASLTAAFNLLLKTEKYISKEAKFKNLAQFVTSRITILTDPPGADVYYREYSKVEGEWKKLGKSPIDSIRMPNRTYFLMKIEKTGYEDLLAVMHSENNSFSRKLFRKGTIPPGMVYVEGLWDDSAQVLKKNFGFFMDRYEVTNKQFKEFVNNGGYRDSSYWINKFVKNGKSLSFKKAISEFADKSGRPGPATWEGGDYPDGQDDYPVNGISWYEAAAYAVYAGKDLPTLSHWISAAEFYKYWFSNFGSKIFPLSNFTGKGPERVGTNQGVNSFGAYDMAGNVREWCWNETISGRVLFGGAWDDPVYMYHDISHLPPFDRSSKNGFRCVKYIEKEKIVKTAFDPIEFNERRDYSKEKPVPENIFRVYKNHFLYDRTELDPVVERRDESSEDWISEKISFNAAYGNERMMAYLFLPRNASPPFQTIVYFPGADATENTVDLPDYRYATYNIEHFLKNGRAVMYPVYKGTFERNKEPIVWQGHQYTDWLIKWVKDFSRSIDYLETRTDIDTAKLVYYGFSWGGALAGIIVAVEDRLSVAMVVTGGLFSDTSYPEADVINYLPRISIPVLMLSGKYDLYFPPETSVKPFFNFLGTPAKDKRLIFYETDHFMPANEMKKETLNWLDKYLGQVK